MSYFNVRFHLVLFLCETRRPNITSLTSIGRRHIVNQGPLPYPTYRAYQPSCDAHAQHGLCDFAQQKSSMHALSAEVLADSSKSHVQRFNMSKPSMPSQSPRRHPEIVPDSARKTNRSFRFSRIMRVGCCPLYHVTMLPVGTSRVSTLRTYYLAHGSSGIFAFVHRWYCCSRVCASNNSIIVIAVEKKDMENLHCRHARTDSAFDGRFQDQTKRERVCMTRPPEAHDGRRA